MLIPLTGTEKLKRAKQRVLCQGYVRKVMTKQCTRIGPTSPVKRL